MYGEESAFEGDLKVADGSSPVGRLLGNVSPRSILSFIELVVVSSPDEEETLPTDRQALSEHLD